jgi:hypothetical protein
MENDMRKVLNEFGYTIKKTDTGRLFRFWSIDTKSVEECSEYEIDKMFRGLAGYKVTVYRKLGKNDYKITNDFAECLIEELAMKSEKGEWGEYLPSEKKEKPKDIKDYIEEAKSKIEKEDMKDFLNEVKSKVIEKDKTIEKKPDELINQEFIMRDDLRDWNFKEDKNGCRYRERIFDEIKKFGVINWFKAKGYPISIDSIWKNRYTGCIEKLPVISIKGKENLEESWNGLTLWENWLPIEIWNEKELSASYKEGTPEYLERHKQEAKNKKDEEKRSKAKEKAQAKKTLSVFVKPDTIINEPKVEPRCVCGKKLMWDKRQMC